MSTRALPIPSIFLYAIVYLSFGCKGNKKLDSLREWSDAFYLMRRLEGSFLCPILSAAAGKRRQNLHSLGNLHYVLT